MQKNNKKIFLLLALLSSNLIFADINVSAGFTQIELNTFDYEPQQEAPQVAEIEIVEGEPVYQSIDGEEVQTEDFLKLA